MHINTQREHGITTFTQGSIFRAEVEGGWRVIAEFAAGMNNTFQHIDEYFGTDGDYINSVVTAAAKQTIASVATDYIWE